MLGLQPHFDHSFVIFENMKRCTHAGNVCVRCQKIETNGSNLFLGFALFGTLLRIFPSLSMTVSDKPTQCGGPRPASDEIISASVLLCATLVCFLQFGFRMCTILLLTWAGSLQDHHRNLHPNTALICMPRVPAFARLPRTSPSARRQMSTAATRSRPLATASSTLIEPTFAHLSQGTSPSSDARGFVPGVLGDKHYFVASK